jgi:hypothetical protein
VIRQIIASQEARITGMSLWYLACRLLLSKHPEVCAQAKEQESDCEAQMNVNNCIGNAEERWRDPSPNSYRQEDPPTCPSDS